MKLAPVRPVNSLVEQVCSQLSSRIRSEPAGGDAWLPPERALAAQLGVSRPVVREAMKRLELQGMLEIHHGSGIKMVDRLHAPLNKAVTLVLPDEAERLRQLTEIRLMVEPESARLAATRASKSQIAALNEALERLAGAIAFEESVTADMDFHRMLADASGNQIAALLLNSLSDLLHVSLQRGYQRVTPDTAVRQHRAVVKAIERGDGGAAARAMRDHLLTAREDLGLNSKRSARR